MKAQLAELQEREASIEQQGAISDRIVRYSPTRVAAKSAHINQPARRHHSRALRPAMPS